MGWVPYTIILIIINNLPVFTLYAEALYKDDDATDDVLREAVMTLEEAERIARRVLKILAPHRSASGAREILSEVASHGRAGGGAY